MKKISRALITVFGVILLVCMGLFAACGTEKYSVTTEFEASQGTVSISPASDDGTYEKGTELTVTVTPNTGYELDAFTVNGEAKELSGGTYRFSVEKDTAVKATFKATQVEAVKYHVTVGELSHGSIRLDPAAADGLYEENTQVKIKVMPEENYLIDGFTVDGEDKTAELVGGEYTFTVTKDTVLAATFKATYSVSFETPEHGAIQLEPSGENVRYPEGSQVKVTLVPEETYIISTFTVNGEDKTAELVGGEYTLTVTKDTVLAATFKATYSVSFETPEHGAIQLDPAGENGRYPEGSEVKVTLVPEETYIISTFTVDGEDKTAELVGGEYTLTVTKDTVLAATFKATYSITVEIEPADKAQYTLSPAEGPYAEGDDVLFTLTPAEEYEPESLTVNGEAAEWDGEEGFVKTLTMTENIQIHVSMKEIPGLFAADLIGEWYAVKANSSNLGIAEAATLSIAKNEATVDGSAATVEVVEGGYTLTVGETVYTLKTIYGGVLVSLTAADTQYLIKSAEIVPVVLPETLQGDWAYGSESDPKIVEIKNDGTISLPFLGNTTGTVIHHDTAAKKFVVLNAYYGTLTQLVATYEEGKSLTFVYNSRNGDSTQECTPAPATLKLTLDGGEVDGGELTDFYCEGFEAFTKNEDGTYSFPVNAEVSFKIKASDGYTVHEVKSSTVSYPGTITPNDRGYYVITTTYKAVTITVTFWKNSIFPEEYIGDWCRITHGSTSTSSMATVTIRYNNGRDSIEYDDGSYSSASDLTGNATDGYTFKQGSYSSKTTYRVILRDGLLILCNADKNTVLNVLAKKGSTLTGVTLSAELGLYNTSWSSDGGSLLTISATGEIAADVASDITTTYPQGNVTVLSNNPAGKSFTAYMDVHYGRYYTFVYDAAASTLTLTDECGGKVVFRPTPKTYTVEVKLSNADGATAALSDPKYKAGYTEGESVTLTLKLNVGFSVESVKIGETVLQAKEDGTYTFEISGDTTVTVTLGTYETVTVTYTRTGGSYPTTYLDTLDGSVFSGSGNSGSEYVFKKGAEATFRFMHSTSNRVVSVILRDESGTERTLTVSEGPNSSYDYYNFTADKNYTLTVTVVQTYQVTINSVTNGTVTIAEGSNVYKSGNNYIVDKDTDITIHVEPQEGYQISSVKAGTYPSNAKDIPGENGTYTYTVTAKVTIYVVFIEVETVGGAETPIAAPTAEIAILGYGKELPCAPVADAPRH